MHSAGHGATALWDCVAHGRTQLNQPHAWFDYDNEAGMRLAVERLAQLGHQRIGLISATPDLNFVRQRVESFQHAMQAGGLAVDPDNLVDNAHDRRAGYQAMQRLLARSPRPTAIIVDNHMSGVGAVRALLDAGRVVCRYAGKRAVYSLASHAYV